MTWRDIPMIFKKFTWHLAVGCIQLTEWYLLRTQVDTHYYLAIYIPIMSNGYLFCYSLNINLEVWKDSPGKIIEMNGFFLWIFINYFHIFFFFFFFRPEGAFDSVVIELTIQRNGGIVMEFLIVYFLLILFLFVDFKLPSLFCGIILMNYYFLPVDSTDRLSFLV